MNWCELHEFLGKLKEANDERFHDRVIVYDSTNGEYLPADIVEFDQDDDDILSPNQLFIFAHDWSFNPDS